MSSTTRIVFLSVCPSDDGSLSGPAGEGSSGEADWSLGPAEADRAASPGEADWAASLAGDGSFSSFTDASLLSISSIPRPTASRISVFFPTSRPALRPLPEPLSRPASRPFSEPLPRLALRPFSEPLSRLTSRPLSRPLSRPASSCAASCPPASASPHTRMISQGTHDQNVDPTPSSDSNPTRPPEASVTTLQMTSPSPVPWANSFSFSKRRYRRGLSLSGMPMPVSET